MPDGVKLTPAELAAMLAEPGRPLVFLDVRPAEEAAREPSPFPNTVAIPLEELEFEWEELDEGDEIVILDREGYEAVRAVQFLERTGFERLWMLKGGLQAWAREQGGAP
ncbi:MAG: sulfurtransferase [Nitrospirae bacterium]|nr:MAG: sulfurtransferase [Nitrospirota bacterium]